MRYPALDGLRGIAVLAVIIAHVDSYAPKTPGTLLFQYGTTGVDLFFVLSGFLITGILYDTRDASGYFRVFYVRRLLRVFPLYYAALAVYGLVITFLFHDKLWQYFELLPWLALYASNIWIALEHSWMPVHTSHFWSLAVEEQYYLLWPGIVFAVRDRQQLIHICSALIALALLARAGFLITNNTLSSYVLLPARIDALAVGSLAALWARGPAGLDAADQIARRWFLPLALAMVMIILAPEVLGYGADTRARAAVLIFSMSFWALFFGASLIRAAALAPTWLASRWLRYTGMISYCMYVVHAPVIGLVGYLGIRSFLPALAVTLVITYAIAAASWQYFERPLLQLRDRFSYLPEAATAPPHTRREGKAADQ